MPNISKKNPGIHRPASHSLLTSMDSETHTILVPSQPFNLPFPTDLTAGLSSGCHIALPYEEKWLGVDTPLSFNTNLQSPHLRCFLQLVHQPSLH